MGFRKLNFLFIYLAVLPYVKSFAQEPRLVLPVGHVSPVITAAYSPDGRYIATGSWDNTAKIWLASEGRLLCDLKGHNNSITSLAFSKNGKFLATCSKDSTIRVWEVNSGNLKVILRGHSDWVNDAVFINNGTQLLSCSWDQKVIKWDIPQGTLLREYEGHTAAVQKIALSPDGKIFASVSDDQTTLLRELSSGKILHTLKGHTAGVQSVVFSRDGTVCLTASSDNTAKLWNTSTGKLLKTFSGHEAPLQNAVFSRDELFVLTSSMDNTAIIWNRSDGSIKHVLKGHEGPVLSAMFDRTGKEVITSSRDKSARIWDAATGKIKTIISGHNDWVNAAIPHPVKNEILTISSDNDARIWNKNGSLKAELKGYLTRIHSATFSTDGKYLLTGSWDNTAKLWRHADGQLLFVMNGHEDWVNSAVFSPSNRFIATASSDKTARIWNTEDGTEMFKLTGHSDLVNIVRFSSDEKWLLTASWDNTARIWSVATGQLMHVLKGHDSVIQTAEFSPDSRFIVTGSWDNTAIVWDVITGTYIRKLKGHTDKIRKVSFSPDGDKILTASWDNTAIIWQRTNGQLLFRLGSHKNLIHTAAFNKDGSLVATGSMDNTSIIWRVADGTPLFHLKGHEKSIYHVAFSPDGKQLATASWDNSVKLWDANSGQLLNTFNGHTEPVTAVEFHPDGNQLMTVSEDNTLKKWNVHKGDLVYTLFVANGSDYLIIDREGRFDGTPGARNKLYYVCGEEVVDLEQFKALGWEPGLAGKLTGINNEPITAKKLKEIDICRQIPKVTENGLQGSNYMFEVKPGAGGLGDVELYVNQKRIRTYKPQNLIKKNEGYVLNVPVQLVRAYFISGESNLVSVRASTRAGNMLSRGAALSLGPSSKPKLAPDLHIISIGVSKYKGEQLKLTYASKDATDFMGIVEPAGKKLFNTDGKPHVFSYLFNTEGNGARWPSKASVKKLIDSLMIRVKPDDVLLLFFAGHGILNNGPEHFYLLTSDAASEELTGVEKEVAISTHELLDWLRRIKANKQVVILDACNSGQVIRQMSSYSVKRDMPADQVRALENLKDKTGTYILSASAAGQAAYETSLFGQGLLTYSLLSGIKLGTALQDNRFIDLSGWFNHAASQVKLLAKEIGGRQDPQIIGNASFAIGMVDKEMVERINLPLKKRIFINSLFVQNDELLSDELELSSLTDRLLKNQSEGMRLSPWVFVNGNSLTDAYSVRGRYEVKGDTLLVKVSVIKGVRERVMSFDISGPVSKKESLAEQIVNRIRLSLPPP